MQDDQACLSAPDAGENAGPGLTVRNLAKRFGDIVAVNAVSFRVPGGLFLSLLGPSGSGKTTVLRLLGGFESADNGQIEIDGIDISRLPAYRRDIGVVFQRYALFPHMTVAENVGFSLKQRGVGTAARNSRVENILELVGLSGLGDRRPTQLSGGQQQRVALGRALIFKPRILVMDEPLAALDKRLRERLQQEIRTLQRQLKITTVYVTHDQTEAFAMSDLVAVMNEGRIEQLDTPRGLYEAPQTEFVARFVGDSNLFRGEAISGEHAMRLPDGAFVRYPSLHARSGNVTLLVRPEKIGINDTEASDLSGNIVRGQVMDATFLGEAISFRVRAAGLEITVRKENCSNLTVFQPGTEVTLSWAVTDTIVL